MMEAHRARTRARAIVLGVALWSTAIACEAPRSEQASVAGNSSGAGGQSAAGSAGSVAGTGGAASAQAGMGGTAGSAGAGVAGTAGGAGSAGQAGASGGEGATGGSTTGGAGGGGAQGASGGSGGTEAIVDAGAGPRLHVFLLLGQSNMAGYPKAQASDLVEEPRIRVLGYDDCAATGRKKDQWAVAVPPLHECWNGAIGPGDWFAKTVLARLPPGDTIGLVPCAISGERIETFLKDGGSKYAWIVDRARLAQAEGGVIEGMLFHQGESNNGDPNWPGKVRTLVEDLRADLELGAVPFLAGELAYDGGCAGHNTQVNKLPELIDHGYVISANGLSLDPADTAWHLHFGHDAQVTFGQRYAQTMIEALGW